MKKSNLKIDEAGFNNCPNRETIEKEFSMFPVEFIDIERDYWENRFDTMVFRVLDESLMTGLDIGNFASRYRVDEFDYFVSQLGTIIRLWWD